MAQAIKAVSVRRGYDVTRYALNSFGGAGGQHACLVADALGMTTVLLHPFSGLLSAYGMGAGGGEGDAPGDPGPAAGGRPGRDPEPRRPAGGRLPATSWKRQGVERDPGPRAGVGASALRRLGHHLRAAGLPAASGRGGRTTSAPRWIAAFEDAHRRRFSFLDPEKPLVIEMVAAEASGPRRDRGSRPTHWRRRRIETRGPRATSRFFRRPGASEAKVWRREALAPGAEAWRAWRSSSKPIRPWWSRPGWSALPHRARTSGAASGSRRRRRGLAASDRGAIR